MAVSSRSRERIEATAAEIGATAFVHDSADVDGARGASWRRWRARSDPVDVLVTQHRRPAAGPDPLGFAREQWEAAYRELVLSPIALRRGAMPDMRARGCGRVVTSPRARCASRSTTSCLQRPLRGLVAAFKTIARRWPPTA